MGPVPAPPPVVAGRPDEHGGPVRAYTPGIVDQVPQRGFVTSSADSRAIPAAGGILLAGADDTGGHFTLIRTTVPPGDQTPLHRHLDMDESFYVIAGSLHVTCGDDSFEATAANFVYLPRGIAHRYVAGEEGAEMLIHIEFIEP